MAVITALDKRPTSARSVDRGTYHLASLQRVRSPKNGRTLAWTLTALFIVAAATLVFVPWQQNIAAKGQVVAFAPTERRQQIQAPISGRVVQWAVVEGSQVREGDLIVEISDNDPSILERLAQEREATLGTLRAAQDKTTSVGEKVFRLEAARLNAVTAARSRLDAADDKVRAAEQGLEAAEAELWQAQLNLDRQSALRAKGLVSTNTLELAQLRQNKAQADVDKAKATLAAEKNDRTAVAADLQKIDADAQAKVEDARASLAAARSDAEKARAELPKVDVRLARQQTQRVTAPIDGTVFRVLGRQSGEQLKAGDPLAVLIPESTKNVVELYVDGNDFPLVHLGDPVRLQFEGWPALQFAGWPSVAIGTFGGRVLQLDAADDGVGRFRILVEPDPEDDPWPSKAYLRQGVLANGWVLLNQVALGYELWRQFNGFPPVISPSEPAVAGKGK